MFESKCVVCILWNLTVELIHDSMALFKHAGRNRERKNAAKWSTFADTFCFVLDEKKNSEKSSFA